MTPPAGGVHERDCTPCDAARAVMAMFVDELDPLDNWRDYEIAGVTEYDRLLAKTAAVLHTFPGPRRRPL